MHLAAFVDDVAAADHRLTVHTDSPTADRRSTVADALPAAAVTLEGPRPAAPGRLGRLDDGSLALYLGDADGVDTGLVIGPALSLERPTSNAPRTLGRVDETTVTVTAGSRDLVDAATRAVASLATDTDTVHLGLGGSVGSAADLGADPDGTVHVYGGADAPSAAGELADSRFAVVDGAEPTRTAAVLVVAEDEGYRGFLTTRTAIVDDLAGYLERRHAPRRSLDAPARAP